MDTVSPYNPFAPFTASSLVKNGMCEYFFSHSYAKMFLGMNEIEEWYSLELIEQWEKLLTK